MMPSTELSRSGRYLCKKNMERSEWFLLWRLRHARRWNHCDRWNIIVDEIFAKACRGAALSSQRSDDVVGITLLSFGEIVDAEDEQQRHSREKV